MSKALRRLLPAAAIIAALSSAGAHAGMRVQPMSYDLKPSGSEAQRDLRVENTGTTPIPVELRAERREILADGSEKRSPAEDDFLLFPPQGIVQPNSFQTFRVRYIGSPTIPKTVLYTVTVAQLPVDTSGRQTSGVQFLFNLGTLAAVSPDHAEADLVVTSVAPAASAGKLRIEVRNQGNRYARLREGKWTFTSADGRTETLEGEALQKALTQPLIEPGTVRLIDLPVSPEFKREGAKAAFQLAKRER